MQIEQLKFLRVVGAGSRHKSSWLKYEKRQTFPSSHSGLRGGGARNFFCRWGQRACFYQFSRCPGPRSTSPTQNFSNLGPPGPQKRPNLAQLGPTWRSEGSGGPKRLEQRGTKVERARGGPSRRLWTNFEKLGAPKFGPGAPKRAQLGPTWRSEGSGGQAGWSKRPSLSKEIFLGLP